ncbi:MAG TPA: DUF2071 domain-containing protein [Pirellulaceae bacterium]|nr:DUF2071 domain-containing protein [Pirellulaceae bacterium]HMO90629.1 DUF2071 domain-containing protein [Pirellulaceae bacterium]HMP67792.1 DUF2071 domain-containing protein [Pirellulaceae bacterium]
MGEIQAKTLYRAEWREIVVVNFEIDPKQLASYVPPKTELDLFDGTAFVSLMCRTCKNVRPHGWPIRVARSVEQIQLRFYVKRTVNDEVRRGICPIRDYVASRKANIFLNMLFKYSFVPVKIKRESQHFDSASKDDVPSVEYRWLVNDHWNRLRVKARSQMRQQLKETKESFVLDHHYGYIVNQGRTLEFKVDYSPWAMWDAQSGSFECNVEEVFGRPFVRALSHRPASVFLARGGDVAIYRPTVV